MFLILMEYQYFFQWLNEKQLVESIIALLDRYGH